MRTQFVINNAQAGYPTRDVDLPRLDTGLEEFAAKGYLRIGGLFDHETLEGFRQALDELVAVEADVVDRMYRGHAGSVYLRWLLTKDRRFHAFNAHPDLIAIARAMLGPQIQLDDADARVSFPGHVDGTGWHIHLRSVPEPMPPFFCYPHALHHLLYLDDVGESEGGLRVLPGSHHDPNFRLSAGSTEDLPGQETIYPRAGEVIMLHANLWHRAVESKPDGRLRRLILGAFSPSWLRTSYDVGLTGPIDWRSEYLSRSVEPAERELTGAFSWA